MPPSCEQAVKWGIKADNATPIETDIIHLFLG